MVEERARDREEGQGERSLLDIVMESGER